MPYTVIFHISRFVIGSLTALQVKVIPAYLFYILDK